MQDLLEWAGGSVPGRDHRHALKNSHDAWHVEAGPGALVAIVCDGCGSGTDSEVGAKLGARIVAKQVLTHFAANPDDFGAAVIDKGLSRVRRSVLGQLQVLADSMAGPHSEIVSEFLLFTIVGALVTVEETFVFGCGDGLFCMNGNLHTMPSKENRPDYLAYGIVDSEVAVPRLKAITWTPTSELQSLLIATDGADGLVRGEKQRIPGKEDLIGPLSQFWREDRFFKNPFALRHRLNLINRDWSQVDYAAKAVREEHGPMADDTTIVVVRKRRKS